MGAVDTGQLVAKGYSAEYKRRVQKLMRWQGRRTIVSWRPCYRKLHLFSHSALEK